MKHTTNFFRWVEGPQITAQVPTAHSAEISARFAAITVVYRLPIISIHNRMTVQTTKNSKHQPSCASNPLLYAHTRDSTHPWWARRLANFCSLAASRNAVSAFSAATLTKVSKYRTTLNTKQQTRKTYTAPAVGEGPFASKGLLSPPHTSC